MKKVKTYNKKKLIGIIDYQAGNINSLKNSIIKLGYFPILIKYAKEINKYNKVILPGVGSFENAINNLKKKKFDKFLKIYLKNKKNKLLGICLGMQLLFEKSQETVDFKKYISGLSFLKGEVCNFSSKEKLMNIGWCKIKSSKNNLLTTGIPNEEKIFYFVHRYYCKTKIKSKNESYANFLKKNFLSTIEKDNIFGVQFHPEKSLGSGLKLLNNFCKL